MSYKWYVMRYIVDDDHLEGVRAPILIHGSTAFAMRAAVRATRHL